VTAVEPFLVHSVSQLTAVLACYIISSCSFESTIDRVASDELFRTRSTNLRIIIINRYCRPILSATCITTVVQVEQSVDGWVPECVCVYGQ